MISPLPFHGRDPGWFFGPLERTRVVCKPLQPPRPPMYQRRRHIPTFFMSIHPIGGIKPFAKPPVITKHLKVSLRRGLAPPQPHPLTTGWCGQYLGTPGNNLSGINMEGLTWLDLVDLGLDKGWSLPRQPPLQAAAQQRRGCGTRSQPHCHQVSLDLDGQELFLDLVHSVVGQPASRCW